MDIKRLIPTACFLLMQGCTSAQNQENMELTNFRSYALATCLGAAFKDPAVQSDFNKAANGFMERGHMSLEAYEELRAVNLTWLEKDYPSKHGGQVNSAKCFDLFKSPEVLNLYNKHDPCLLVNEWLDPNEFKEACS